MPPKPKRVTLEEWKRSRAFDGSDDPPALQKFNSGAVEKDAHRDDVLSFTISTAGIDRDNDILAIDGWELDSFRKNPVMLWAHDASLPPIARSLAEWVEGDSLRSRAEFTPADLAHPLGDGFGATVARMFRERFLNTTSVGFRPLEWEWSERDSGDGIDFSKQELLEFSAVPVPANAEALVQLGWSAKERAPLRRWVERMLDGEASLWLPRPGLEDMHKALKGSATVAVPGNALPTDVAEYVKSLFEASLSPTKPKGGHEDDDDEEDDDEEDDDEEDDDDKARLTDIVKAAVAGATAARKQQSKIADIVSEAVKAATDSLHKGVQDAVYGRKP